jgi:hypothetical protein
VVDGFLRDSEGYLSAVLVDFCDRGEGDETVSRSDESFSSDHDGVGVIAVGVVAKVGEDADHATIASDNVEFVGRGEQSSEFGCRSRRRFLRRG